MSASVFHALCYHFVWSTKGRTPVLSRRWRDWIIERVDSEAQKRGGTVFACNAMPDHVHLVVSVPPTIAVCQYIGQVKGASSFGRSYAVHLNEGKADEVSHSQNHPNCVTPIWFQLRVCTIYRKDSVLAGRLRCFLSPSRGTCRSGALRRKPGTNPCGQKNNPVRRGLRRNVKRCNTSYHSHPDSSGLEDVCRGIHAPETHAPANWRR